LTDWGLKRVLVEDHDDPLRFFEPSRLGVSCFDLFRVLVGGILRRTGG
jgi:hypothetical protein